MSFAIAHIKNAAIVNQHTVWPRERASKGIGFWTIASVTGAEHGSDDACLEINLANDMTFCIGHVQRVT